MHPPMVPVVLTATYSSSGTPMSRTISVMVPFACASKAAVFEYWSRFTAPGICSRSCATFFLRAASQSPVSGSGLSTLCTVAPSALMVARVAVFTRGSTTQWNSHPRRSACRASAMPKFPELDSTRAGVSPLPVDSCPASMARSTNPAAVRSLALPPGLNCSSLTQISTSRRGHSRSRRSRGVLPVSDRKPLMAPDANQPWTRAPV